MAALNSARPAIAAPETNSYFYSGGKKHELKASARWVAVELEPGASAAGVTQAAKALPSLDKKTPVVGYSRKPILVFPAGQEGTASVRQQLRSGLAGTRGVRRVLRTFGNGNSPIVETDEFLIRFQSGVSRGQAVALLKAHGATIVASLGRYAPNGYRVRVTNPDTGSAITVANALYTQAQVVWSLPNLIWPKQKRFTPNDPLYPQQWHLNNTGQEGGTAGADVKAPAAWDISRGSTGVTVAIVDDGVDIDHVELSGAKLVPGYDFLSNDNDPRPALATNNHGTACAGVAVASGHNGVGVAGIAPNCKLMPIRLVGTTDLDMEAKTFEFAADNGADIISNSWGPDDNKGPAPLPDNVRDAIRYAATNGRGGKGCIIFWAAGNGNESADSDGYAANPDVITVAASTNQDVKAWYSDFGTSVDICAPSGGGTSEILTVDRTGTVGYSPANGYTNNDYANDFTGTSSACPLAAGVAALMLSVNPGLTRTEVQTLLQNTADKIDTAGGAYNTSGHSAKYGHGRVNALRAVQAAAPVAPATYTVSGRITDSQGAAISNVSVTRTGSTTAVLTNAAGDFSFSGVAAGTYTITPALAQHSFTPASRSTTVTNANVTGVNFTGTRSTSTLTYSIRGRIANHSGSGMPNIQVTRSGGPNVLTDANGDYIFNNLAPGDYTIAPLITPSLSGVTLYPASRSVTIGTSSLSNQNFTASFSISGNLSNHSGVGIPNVQIQRVAGASVVSAFTDANGNYRFSDVRSGNYSIAPVLTPSMTGMSFFPTATAVTVDRANLTNINFQGTFTISGRLTNHSGVGIPNVQIQRVVGGSVVSVFTNANGNYSFSGVRSGTYTLAPVLTPAMAGMSFTPTTLNVTVDRSNITNQNFIGMFSVSGRIVTSSGAAIAGALVRLNTGTTSTSTTTDADGNYRFSNVRSGSYTLVPEGEGANPASRDVTVNTLNIINQNFIGAE